MYILRAFSLNGPIMIGVNQFAPGEAVFEMVVDIKDPTIMQRGRTLGQVKKEADVISIEYTDQNFKKLIDYQEDSGFSTMDGGLWASTLLGQSMMYNGSKNPCESLAHTIRAMQSFFAQQASSSTTPSNAGSSSYQPLNKPNTPAP